MTEKEELLDKLQKVLTQATPLLPQAEVRDLVRSFLSRHDAFVAAVQEKGSPLYVFDKEALTTRAKQFVRTFERIAKKVTAFFAVKSNNCPLVMQTVVDCGLGLDVSSGLELAAALDTGCSSIVFSGPGKTATELALAVDHGDRVTILLDSFGELGRVGESAGARGKAVKAGVRLTTNEHGLWRKFGIPLSSLKPFMERANECEYVDLCGIQFHRSWNLSPKAQVDYLVRLGEAIKELPAKQRSAIKFIDIGGGYWPPAGEWLQPTGTLEGRIYQLVHPGFTAGIDHYKLEAKPLPVFAESLREALRVYIFPWVDCEIYMEPGRWLSNEAMHLAMTVVDKKADDMVITDAGTNLIGWERFESDYFPVINLTRPAVDEKACMVFGSLCTPHDVWGRGYFGESIELGDILLIPNQGAYTYSLRQQFIKPVAEVIELGNKVTST